MSKVRNDALMNGVCIGGAWALFVFGWFIRHTAHELAQGCVEKFLPAYPNDPSLIMFIEYLKTTGDKGFLICIIFGIILLGMGIGVEVYQRAKKENS